MKTESGNKNNLSVRKMDYETNIGIRMNYENGKRK
jgi:hypothetical protein